MPHEWRNVSNRSNFGNLVFSLPYEERKIVRKLERLKYKLNAAETAATFNLICLQEGLLPNYTRLRLHDPNAADDNNTRAFRRRLSYRQLQEKKEKIRQLKQDIHHTTQQWKATQQEEHIHVLEALEVLVKKDLTKKEKTSLKKLSHLNGGKLRLPKNKQRYINLSEYTPTPEEEELLQLGLNCHYADKPLPIRKRLEIEVLIDNLMSLEREGKVELKEPLKPLLLAEALTDRTPPQHHSLMSKELRNAAKHLKQQEGITVRRADKTPAIVLIPTEEYHNKLDNILADESKFQKIRRNPVDDIKREANGIIERINALSGDVKLPIIRGDFEPGYVYGNVKTHKTGNPLRPIISQIPTPTYKLAKRLNSLLTPYIPSKYRVQSSSDFLSIVRRTTPQGVIASLDVESLFTNVPVQETIDLICDRVYRDTTTPTLGIPEDALKHLLQLCTMRAPFRTHRGELYNQVDGVAMGSPLGVLFADFYMGVVEERVFSQHQEPHTYCRYVDDTFVQADTFEDIEALRQKFEEHSSLRFTSERSVNGALPFLDVLLEQKWDTDTNVGGTPNTNNDNNTNTVEGTPQEATRIQQDTPGTLPPQAGENLIQEDLTTPGVSTASPPTPPLPQRVLRSHTRRYALSINPHTHTHIHTHDNTNTHTHNTHTHNRNNTNNDNTNTHTHTYNRNNTNNTNNTTTRVLRSHTRNSNASNNHSTNPTNPDNTSSTPPNNLPPPQYHHTNPSNNTTPIHTNPSAYPNQPQTPTPTQPPTNQPLVNPPTFSSANEPTGNTHTHTHIPTLTHTHMHTHTTIPAHTHTHTHDNTNTHTHRHDNTNTHTYTHTHTNTHTHTHTNTNNNISAFITSVYRKPTNMGMCLNGISECPARYKNTTISAFIRRALTHCSSWKSTIDEIEFSSQMLINNGYSNKEIDKATRHILDRWYDNNDNTNNNSAIKIYYKNQYHRNYRQDEKALRDIINENVKARVDGTNLKTIIYYNNKRTVNLILKNNPNGTTDKLKRRNVVYHYRCPFGGCPAEYVGMTTTTLSKRISCHVQEGNIFNHVYNDHHERPTRDMLIEAIDIVDYDADPRRLRILEALHIGNKKPSINITQEPLLLPSCTVQRPR